MTPLSSGPALSSSDYADVCRRMVFDSGKFDLQFADTAVLARYPLVLERHTWLTLARTAERLTAEVLAAESELAGRPELHGALALPRRIRRELRARAARSGDTRVRASRYIRYDFHLTTEGWRISEANTDVPGGLLEGSALSQLMGGATTAAEPADDPTAALADALADPQGVRRVALVHATAYTDDRQVMRFLQQELGRRGVEAELVSPVQLRRRNHGLEVQGEWLEGPRQVDAVFRFFPAEWLANLPRHSDWPLYFDRGISQCNPATALLTQSKRFPLVWEALRTPLPTWRAMLPETRDPRAAPWRTDEGWVIKAALGRVGEEVGLRGATRALSWRKMERSARLWPRHWIAQRRFEAAAIDTPDGPRYPCLGIFVFVGGQGARSALDGATSSVRAAGIYGRLAARPLIDSRAQDVAVLVAKRAASDVVFPEESRHVA